MIISPGDFDAVSFNDDTSPDSRRTDGQRLSINAQVMPGNSLDWYFRILQACESIRGELKSNDVWLRLQELDGECRLLIWNGLSKVRIHMVDPRPYKASLEEVLRKVFNWEDPAKMLSQGVQLKDPRAMWLSAQMQVMTAGKILDDSAGGRVHSLSKFLIEVGMPPGAPGGVLREEVLQLSDFGEDTKPLVRKVSAWAAKSAAAFHEALDCFLEQDVELRFYPSDLIRRRMASRILDSHAFDKGNQRHIELLEDARTNILTNLGDYRGIRLEDTKRPYLQIDSVRSYLVQAADIAAGIASKIHEFEGLVAVVSRFEYVTYNGDRFAVADAEDHLRRMRWRDS
jgi:hypothetical protein